MKIAFSAPAAAITLTIFSATSLTYAEDIFWTGFESNDFNDPLNWDSDGNVPGADDVAMCLDWEAEIDFTLAADHTTQRLLLWEGALNVSGGFTYLAGSTGDAANANVIGDGGSASLSVTGPGTIFQTGRIRFATGLESVATLSVTDGAVLHTDQNWLVLGSTGKFTGIVSGEGSGIIRTGTGTQGILIGDNAADETSKLTIENGAYLSSSTILTVGNNTGAKGELELIDAASSTVTNAVNIGRATNTEGTLTLTNSNLSITSTSTSGTLHAGREIGATGIVTLIDSTLYTGHDSCFGGGAQTITDNGGSGTLHVSGGSLYDTRLIMFANGPDSSSKGNTITDGGVVRVRTSWVVVGRGAEADLMISGEGSVLEKTGGAGNHINIGDWFTSGGVTIYGNGTVTVSDGGTLRSSVATNDINIGQNGATGLVQVNGGNVSSARDIVVGSRSEAVEWSVGSSGTLNVDGGFVIAMGNIVLGDGGISDDTTGRLNVSNGGKIRAAKIRAGVNADAAATFNGAIIEVAASSSDFFIGFEPGDLNIQPGGLTFDLLGSDVTLASGLSGAGGLTKQGAGNLTMASGNSYKGNTAVNEGLLTFVEAAHNKHSEIHINDDGIIYLNFSGEMQVAALYIDGVLMEEGTWGSGEAAVDHVDDLRFMGEGILRVVTSSSSGYEDWAAIHAGGGEFDQDFDQDGIPNGMEYFFGVEPGFTPNPAISANNTITWPRDPEVSDVSFTVQTSTTLMEGDWSDVANEDLDLSDPDAISYILPAQSEGNSKLFVRFRVTRNEQP